MDITVGREQGAFSIKEKKKKRIGPIPHNTNLSDHWMPYNY